MCVCSQCIYVQISDCRVLVSIQDSRIGYLDRDMSFFSLNKIRGIFADNWLMFNIALAGRGLPMCFCTAYVQFIVILYHYI